MMGNRRKKKGNLDIIALIISIVSLCTCSGCCCLGLVGLILSIVVLADDKHKYNKGIGGAALALSVVSLLMMCGVGFFGGNNKESDIDKSLSTSIETTITTEEVTTETTSTDTTSTTSTVTTTTTPVDTTENTTDSTDTTTDTTTTTTEATTTVQTTVVIVTTTEAPVIIPVTTSPPSNGGGYSPPERSYSNSYILNTNTKKFHYPSCSSVSRMNESNKQDYYGSRDDIIAMGYSPCQKCCP